MKCKVRMAWMLAGCMAIVPGLCAQAQHSDAGKQQTQQKNAPQQPAAPQANGNPFPEDEKAVPVLPSGNSPYAADDAAAANNPDAAPSKDSDPVHSPEEAAPGGSESTEGFSSSRNGLDNLAPDPDTEPSNTKGKRGGDSDVEPHETVKEDLDVGNYYMDRKDWRGALSRFESALVLAPDNPDVYWGLAECERHLGQYAQAKASYTKVAEYDPDSKHGKDAKKALDDPSLANATPQH